MHQLRFKGLLKIFLWTINLALIVEIAIAAIVIILMLVIINSDENLVSGWSAFLPEINESYTVSQSPKIETATASAREVHIQFSATGMIYYFLKFIETIFNLSIIIWITFLLGKIFRSLHNEHPFTVRNAIRLRTIASLIIAIIPFSTIQSLVYRNYISNNISIEGKTYVYSIFPMELAKNEIWLDFQMNLQYLLIGGLLLLVAEIFRIGVFFKEDSESIL
ncbi:DUF2975 domain-containing protein [Portibacter marinus]|uniref:DUF2975 domain-containing protein n=1 Tax=Portibacter marinus TaxID=2898660 RepID=UPI001F424080|nr:DUF2975 domain-containing protein [Portibacter marinus]